MKEDGKLGRLGSNRNNKNVGVRRGGNTTDATRFLTRATPPKCRSSYLARWHCMEPSYAPTL